MRQIKSPSKPFGFLDPEKVYFVEKFGYLLKKIDSGFGGPIQDALYQRIFTEVDKFKDDLPDVVRDLEKTRLNNIIKRNISDTTNKTEPNNSIPKIVERSKSDRLQKKELVTKVKSDITKKELIETEIEIDIDIDKPNKQIVPNSITSETKSNSKSSILIPSDNVKIPTQKIVHKRQSEGLLSNISDRNEKSSIIEKQEIENDIDLDKHAKQIASRATVHKTESNSRSSILIPSAATIREENRQKQIQKIQKRK